MGGVLTGVVHVSIAALDDVSHTGINGVILKDGDPGDEVRSEHGDLGSVLRRCECVVEAVLRRKDSGGLSGVMRVRAGEDSCTVLVKVVRVSEAWDGVGGGLVKVQTEGMGTSFHHAKAGSMLSFKVYE